MTMALTLNTAPAAEPVTLAEVKAYLSIDTSDTSNDTLLASLLMAARGECENFTKQAFITQTWDLWLDCIPGPKGGRRPDVWFDGTRDGYIPDILGATGVIDIPKVPLASITLFESYGTDDSSSTFDSSNYVVDTDSKPGRVFLKQGATWPVSLRSLKAIHIRFTAGYSADGSKVPDPIKQAIKLLVSHFFENRTPIVEGRLGELPYSVTALLDSYRVRSIR